MVEGLGAEVVQTLDHLVQNMANFDDGLQSVLVTALDIVVIQMAAELRVAV